MSEAILVVYYNFNLKFVRILLIIKEIISTVKFILPDYSL